MLGLYHEDYVGTEEYTQLPTDYFLALLRGEYFVTYVVITSLLLASRRAFYLPNQHRGIYMLFFVGLSQVVVMVWAHLTG